LSVRRGICCSNGAASDSSPAVPADGLGMTGFVLDRSFVVERAMKDLSVAPPERRRKTGDAPLPARLDAAAAALGY